MDYVGLLLNVWRILAPVLQYLWRVVWPAYLRPVLQYLRSVLSQYPPLVVLQYLTLHLLPYEVRVIELAMCVHKLRKEKNRVQQIAVQVKGNWKNIDDDIKWFKEVDQVVSDYEDFLTDEDRPHAVFSDGYLPKPGIRYCLSRTVYDLSWRVNVLLQRTKPELFSNWLRPFNADFDFASRNETMDGIMDALADPNVGLIGVYGLSGVGKTSLIKHVAKKVKGNMFDLVIMVDVTSCPDIRRIQGQIADNLRMSLEEESATGRAAHLQERLKNTKEKTLIILDNIRVKMDFKVLEIPLEKNHSSQMNHKMRHPSAQIDASSLMRIEERPASYKGCKVLMISDDEQILSSQMDGKENQLFLIEVLTEKDSRKLFRTVAEIDDRDSLFQIFSNKIAELCKGLPMTIVTTANALKNMSLPTWRDTYEKLERQNLIAETPDFYTRLSYDLLEDEELKHTFLICARMGHDAQITDLVRYCIGLGLYQGIYSVSQARDKVHAMVGKLKQLSLLSDSYSSDRFTMHDIIRNSALSIASQQMHAFTLTMGKLDQWPDQDKLKRYTVISLQQCDMITGLMKEFPKRISCFRLRVFHLSNKDPCLEIPENFFNGMKELQVLILTDIHLSPLPSSIKCLKRLRMLCLERCKLGEHLSIIGELETLRVLSLSGSDIERLPGELRQLSRLQVFDISNCFTLKEIPADVLSSLTNLEEFYVGNSPIQWRDEEVQGNQSGNASLSELRHLNQLTTLDIQIPKVTILPMNLFLDKLDSYKIIIRDFNAGTAWDFIKQETCEASRHLALQLEKGFDIHYRKEIKLLFKRVENLLLGQINDVRDIFYELNCEGFPYLKYLSIVSNSKVKSIINSVDQYHFHKAFPQLESLFLYEVNNMEHICHSQLTSVSFSKLKIIKLKICGKLKNVFYSSMIKHLNALEAIEVSECNSLKEIVTLEMKSIGYEIEFPELRSLKLQSLSEFIGFYIDDASTMEQVPNRKPNELFNEKVAIPKLKRMELSSIKIQKIWNEQPLTRSYFQNLIHLDVNDCGNMRYLLSLSMSKSLRNLQRLFLSECEMMESIFIDTQVGGIEIEESIFPKLKIINLRSMKRLREIWTKFPAYSFGRLDGLIIEGCNRLKNVFPSYMVGRYSSLCELKVTNCKSMKEIFDLREVGKRDAGYMITSLQNIHVEALPKLDHIWNKDPKGILRFESLERIWVLECLVLKNIFPVSIAMDLKHLEYLEVWNCDQLREIVFLGETINVSSFWFNLPKLTTARFSKLPNLESFFGGAHELHCSTLNNLSVEHCHKLKLFRTEIANPMKPVFLPKQVIWNLKSIQIEPIDENALKRYRIHKLEDCQLSRLLDTGILYFLLHTNPNLRSLVLTNCFFEQLVSPSCLKNENFGVVPMLKSMVLVNLSSLKMIGFENYTILFRRLECLIIKECQCLNTIAPSSVSFTCLTNLEVSNCNKLSYLMTPSTATSLVQLITMKVIQCESMVAIVSEPENEKRKQCIIFRQLKEIELNSLNELEYFCGSNHCVIEFPSLENFVVSACCKMKMFTFSEQVNKTPNLRQICVTHGEEVKRFYWKGDLNATIQHMHTLWALDPDKVVFSHPYTLLESFQLKILKLTNCELGSHGIPTVVLLGLKNLEELEVSNTNLEVIFDIIGVDMNFPLKKLALDNLPNLIQVWDKDREGILSFQNLLEVLVTNCKQLKALFPSELAERVEKLERLAIRNCEMFQEIVAQEEENEITKATKKISFPSLTSLNLCRLPQLSCFCHRRFTLECPDLNDLEVTFCDKLKSFQNEQEAQCSTSVNRQPLFSQGKATFILESLKLDWKHTMMLCNGNFPEDMFHKLVELELDFDNANDNEVLNCSFGILENASSLEYLQINRCRVVEELFHSRHETKWNRNLTALFPPVYEKLQKLCLSSCPDLRRLVHSPVPFFNLKQLYVKDCHGLRYLFTSATARQLVFLEEIYVVECQSIEVILAESLHDHTYDDIRFERLNTIILDSLPRLWCFYSGTRTLLLPSIIRMLIWKCPNMKIFSQGDIRTKSFLGIQVSLDPKQDLLFHHDLNTTVNMYEQREFFEALYENRFSDNLELQESWVGIVGPQINWLCNLVYLKLEKFTVPRAIPSVILPHLNKLKELEVQKSEKVEVIFYMNDAEIMEEAATQLKKLTLKGLSALTHVWEGNIEGVLIFPNLQKVIVSDCENLQTLFPASLAKTLEKLKKLEVESCHELKAIVGEQEGNATVVAEKFLFPRLEKLDLCALPQLTYFYPHTFTLQCPALNSLSVLDCHELELFQSAHPRQPLISNLKVISNMKELSLDWKHIAASCSRFRSEQFAEGLNYLEKISLFFDADENEKPMLPIEILQKALNLINIRISYCNSPVVFLAQDPKIKKDRMLPQLEILALDKVSAL